MATSLSHYRGKETGGNPVEPVPKRDYITRMIETDFHSDWIEILRHRLTEMGYSIPFGIDDKEVSIAYFNALRRRIEPIPRAIKKSKSFSYPSNLLQGLKNLEAKILSGENIDPYLSRGLKRSDKKDLLLNDWGVHHLHLGTKLESDGFAERTGPVLFSLFNRDVAHLIQIYEHGNWANVEVVKIVHENWPELTSKYKHHGVIGHSFDPDSNDMKILRNRRVNTLLKMDDGSGLAPLGGWMSLNGTSIHVVMHSDRAAMIISDFEKSLHEDPDQILKFLKEEKSWDGVTQVKLLLRVDDKGKFYAYSEKFSVTFLMG